MSRRGQLLRGFHAALETGQDPARYTVGSALGLHVFSLGTDSQAAGTLKIRTEKGDGATAELRVGQGRLVMRNDLDSKEPPPSCAWEGLRGSVLLPFSAGCCLGPFPEGFPPDPSVGSISHASFVLGYFLSDGTVSFSTLKCFLVQ